ncbi:LSU ribosomal protein L25P [Limimonas halophila]|uniref:Large ribosomal subunit protein bL25 n=1 Tax=Limimonas halophila TaxID=1082479 RepID=A0A1G7LED5_9PROT|nr:50S ribosomal protein L25/general stress protein Ctc [Limimonas halophila]SDF47932.1 LSU ribosomal protein L25P [Limimonas halophila]
MTETHRLDAQLRTQAGKGAAKRDRKAGRVPAVVYGANKQPTMITVEPGDLDRELNTPGFFTRLYDIRVDGKKAKEMAVVRDMQRDPVTDRPIHLDFLRVAPSTQVTIEVPVHFSGHEQSPGLERGGVLDVVRHEVEMLSRADSIPSHLDIDLSKFDVGDSIHISHVDLPEGSQPSIQDRDFTIATISAPRGMKKATTEEGEGEEEAEGGEET